MKNGTVLAAVCAAALFCWAALPAGAIVNGQLDGDLHPEVATLVGDLPPYAFGIPYCSGTLVSPTVVVTAAHCDIAASGGTFRGVSFAPRYTPGDRVLSGTFHADPNFNPSQSDPADVGVVVLDKGIKSVTPAGLPALGLLDGMMASGTLQSTQFTSVGYGDFQGVPDSKKPPFPNDGYRR